MAQQNNNGLLTVIVVVLIAIAGLVGYQVFQEEQKPDNPVEAIGQSLEDAGDRIGGGMEELGNDIEDSTDGN